MFLVFDDMGEVLIGAFDLLTIAKGHCETWAKADDLDNYDKCANVTTSFKWYKRGDRLLVLAAKTSWDFEGKHHDFEYPRYAVLQVDANAIDVFAVRRKFGRASKSVSDAIRARTRQEDQS